MDELTIEGKLYISSKRAAKLSGYAKDYIGQLCREGRVDSKLVGRSWYVYEPSIREHRFNDERPRGKKNQIEEKIDTQSEEIQKSPIDTSWERPSYTSEVAETLPELVTAVKASPEPETLGEMQSAWKEWFAERGAKAPQTSEREEEAAVEELPSITPAYSAPKVETVPVRVIVSDIKPIPQRQEERAESPTYSPQQASVRSQIKPKTRTKARIGGLVIKSSFIAFIVILVSITVVATGLIEELHLGGLSDSPFLQYFQGSNVVEK
ncbi:MAG TPA: hypothetical protein PK109_00525 [Candidatus Paceibacterota bacterium]|nr:hypothetical protein [Candidatus Paceibacterota bacterium]